MVALPARRTIYGPAKYAAFHLLLARWIRHYAKPIEYAYVTLGGTELRDIQSVYFIDNKLASNMTSCEMQKDRFEKARESSNRLEQIGLSVSVSNTNIFTFNRGSEKAHLFFVDLQGICAFSDMHVRFAKMIRTKAIREGDALFITSYLGRHRGWDKVYSTFDAEFRLLELATATEKRRFYARAHPSFTLYSALAEADSQDEISLRCIGCIKYYDSSPMAIYGYVIEAGTTSFRRFVQETPFFDIKHGLRDS